MKEAIGAFNGWRCPSCKRLVAQPKVGNIGKCKMCGEEIYFSAKQEVREPIEAQEGVEIPVKIIKEDQGRPVVVNFLNRPLLLKSFEQYAKDKNLFLTEVVLGFAAMGFKFYREKTALEKAITPK